MQILSDQLHLSATDLANHLACKHLTELDHASARGKLPTPKIFGPMLELLFERGLQHERRHVDMLREQGKDIHDIETRNDALAVQQTLEAMRAGHDVIVQGGLAHGRWRGRTDLLLKVGRPGDLGAWSYEVADTKLSRETKGGTILQLCLYAYMLEQVQGVLPEHLHVVTPLDAETYRTADFMAYFRLALRKTETAVGQGDEPCLYPEPVAHCDVCRWRSHCEKRRRADDHLSLVANITSGQRRELTANGIDTLAQLAVMPLPLPWSPQFGNAASYERSREQARVQLAGRDSGQRVHELILPVESGSGLAQLPEPSRGDVFFDIEGDAFVGTQGLEYLFGYVTIDKAEPRYERLWALNLAEEKHLFEQFMDMLTQRLEQYPDFHIYHYAPYEPAALKRLMGRHATRADQLDALLRSERFVDLYAVVRQGLRASVERYSIKDLEPFFNYEREVDLTDANVALRGVEWPLELNQPDTIDPDAMAKVVGYNRDDCMATWALRDWLEVQRGELIAKGHVIERPVVELVEPGDNLSEWLERIRALQQRLTHDVPEDPDERSEEQQARWVLAQLLEYHRREDKVAYWEKFRLLEMPPDELIDEKVGLYDLEYLQKVEGGTARCPVHRYSFPRQEFEAKLPITAFAGGDRIGDVLAVDPDARTVDIKKAAKRSDEHPEGLFIWNLVNANVQVDALERLASWVADHGLTAPGAGRGLQKAPEPASNQAAVDLLLRCPPRTTQESEVPLLQENELTLDAAKRLVTTLNGGTLALQGPPGSGKTYTGAHMICQLIAQGKKVGVTAVSHKVVRNLMDKVLEVAALPQFDLSPHLVHKTKPDADYDGPIDEIGDNKKVELLLAGGDFDVVGGTAWLWAREKVHEKVDVLFIDEAGQMSMASVLAAAQTAHNLVLLGDPIQLEQPQQASHPDGTAMSALEYLLYDPKIMKARKTMPDHLGLFLARTWRLHPDICRFTSEVFYDGRLQSIEGLQNQRIEGQGAITGSGLRFHPVEHTGNQSASQEEANAVRDLVGQLLSQTWFDQHNQQHPITTDDILIVAPYNAQVNLIRETLPGARVGTVDKFQGQEAPVVIYSMATSSAQEAPRGMDFLYSASRFNVATSRARCACILVANPALFDTECQTPGQMRLANAFCHYLEQVRDGGP